jgi:hypothetical protein
MTTRAAVADKRIVESSSLAASFLHRGYAYTGNDDPKSPNHLFVLDIRPGPNFGKTVGTCSIEGARFTDMEAVAVSGAGNIGLGDIGDNELVRKWIAVWIAPEPDKVTGHHTLDASRYRFAYPDGRSHNSETLLFHPLVKRRLIVTKENGRARVYALPDKPSRTRVNPLRYVATIDDLSLVTDGSYTPDGRHMVFREKGRHDTVAVVDAATFELLGRFHVDPVKQPESITVEWAGDFIVYGSEGARSPLIRTALPDPPGGTP